MDHVDELRLPNRDGIRRRSGVSGPWVAWWAAKLFWRASPAIELNDSERLSASCETNELA